MSQATRSSTVRRDSGAAKPGPRRWIVVAVVTALVAAAVIVIASVLRTMQPVEAFVASHPGVAATALPVAEGFPAWLRWQHFLNFFFLALIVRTGIGARREVRPAGYWMPRGRSTPRVRLIVFGHLSLDLLWVLNGIAYVVLLFATGRWVRIVPTSLDVFPNAASAAIQYASLQWPTDSGWVHYNALQQIAYTVVIFVLAPAAIVTGLRLSPLWPSRGSGLFTVDRARSLHYPIMLGFVGFTIVHVALVLLTGAGENLSHMFWGERGGTLAGILMFALAILATVGAVLAVRPLVLRSWAGLFGTVTR